ncbi:hypothetical protein P171DRAFT_391217, partial [Karstenula rhodostoma CBS 690.94]
MPATIRPSPSRTGTNTDETVTSAEDLIQKHAQMTDPFAKFAKELNHLTQELMHISFSDIGSAAAKKLIPYANSFFEGIMRAYQQDLHLILRPDDVWQAFITQFSFYVNGLADREKEFVLSAENTIGHPDMMDVAKVARNLSRLVEEKLDEDIRRLIIPDFTTTTETDVAVASITMLATTQKYFEYRTNEGCGFPSVTLLGERDDWVKMRTRLDTLPIYGLECAEWGKLLVPIFDRFIAMFDCPGDERLKKFWLNFAYSERNGCRTPDSFSGWMTAFAFWQADGSRSKGPRERMVEQDASLLTLDGHVYPRILQGSVPHGVVRASVVIRYHGQTDDITDLVAGSVGMTVVEENEQGTTVQPRSGWWMTLNKKK